MVLDAGRTVRGALAGTVAAGAWLAQQPLDKRAFDCGYDDAELLGKLVTREDAWLPVGVAIHLLNGAAFGAAYANVAPRLPLPSWLRGPAAAMAEHVAGWPLTLLLERVHPARKELPSIATSPRAFAQATWRHLLFGVVMGELERRLNGPEDDEIPDYAEVASSNGHRSFEAAIATG